MKRLGNDSKVVRDAAVAELRKFGRFARPVLERLYTSASQKIKKQLDLLLG